MPPCANFSSERRFNFVIVRNHGRDDAGNSIAADADAVVATCLQLHGNHRIIYRRRPDGTWCELRHDGERYLDVVDLAADELEQILERCGLEF
jgi:hypothetical protein